MKDTPPRHDTPIAAPRTSRAAAASTWAVTLWSCVLIAGAARSDETGSVSAWFQPDVDRIYQGQRFTITLYIRTVDTRLEKPFNLLNFPGDKIVCDPFRELPVERRMTAGILYETRRFRCVARAVTPGESLIAAILQTRILTREVSTHGPPRILAEPKDVEAKPLTLNVMPLPAEGRPNDFSGAVGRFSFDVDVAPSNVVVGTIVTTTMTIAGDGWLNEIQVPRVSPGRHFRVYEPEPRHADKEGRIRVEQVLVPQNINAVHIPRVTFTFFDPGPGAYKALHRGPFTLSVRPADDAAHAPNDGRETAIREKALKLLARLTWISRAVRALTVLSSAAAAAALLLALTQKRRSLSLLAGAMIATACLLGISMQLDAGAGTRAFAKRGTTARLAPAYSALVTFHLPAGATVRVVETHGRWAKVTCGHSSGWVFIEDVLF